MVVSVMNIPLVVSAAALALTAGAAAQTVAATATAITDLSVRTPTASRSVPAPYDLTPGLLLELTATGMFTRTQVTCDHDPRTGTRYRILDHWQVLSTYPGPHGAFGTGPHSTLLRLVATQPIAGRLVVSAASSVRNGSTLLGRVDIHDDGSDDFIVVPGPYQEQEFPLTVTPAGVVIKTTTATAGMTDGTPGQWWTAKVDLTVAFVPARTCRADRIADTCGPTIATALTFANELAVDVGTSAPNATAVLLLGVNPLLVPLPAPYCGFLTTDPLVVVHRPFVANAARFLIPLPPGPLPGPFYTQGAAVWVDTTGALRVPLTWGLRLSCP